MATVQPDPLDRDELDIALAPYNTGVYTCDCPGDYCRLVCTGRETLSDVVRGLVADELERHHDALRDVTGQNRGALAERIAELRETP